MKNLKYHSASSDGFTLVEIMVVVALAGILAAIAIPSYESFVRKVKLSSAKMLLSDLYIAEKTFYIEYSSFTSRLDAIAFAPEGNLYFNIGFETDFAPPSEAPQGKASCLDVCPNPSCTYSNTWNCLKSATFGLDGNSSNDAKATQSTFRAEAHGHLNGINGSGSSADSVSFSIDEQKQLVEIVPAN
jgi:prepilin-type N-terminal cleavage/methylation domain-containing protein